MFVIIVVTGFLLDTTVLFDSSAWDIPRPITTNIANIDTLLAIALFFFFFTSLVSSVSVSVFLIKKRLCCLEWFR